MYVPKPKHLPSGTWQIYLRLGGTGISVTDETKQGVVAKARAIKAQYQADAMMLSPTKPSDHLVTLGDVLDRYIKRYTPVLSPSTIRGYGIIRRNRFARYMDKPFDLIDYQRMVNYELKLVSAKTVSNAWGLVRSALDDAGQTVPKVKLPPAPPKETPFLQPDEIKPFLQAIENTDAELLLLLELHGLRYSEARALTMSDVDLDKNVLYVRSAVVPGPDHKYVKKRTTKNRTSYRTVPIMIPRLVTLLTDCTDRKGTLVSLHPLTGQRAAERACEDAGVTVVTNHGLRHTFASLCYHLGIPERQIMEWGGWSNTVTMHKIYIRIATKDRAKNAERLGQFFTDQNSPN